MNLRSQPVVTLAPALKVLEKSKDVKADPVSKKPSVTIPASVITYPEGNLKYNNISFGEVIGDGHSGMVYSGKYLNTPVAIKIYEAMDSKKLSAFIVDEFKTMNAFRSPYILKAIGYTLNPPCLVTELMSKGSIEGLLKYEFPSFYLLIQLALDAAKGLKFLHDQNIIHRDIKSANILVDQQYRAKLADLEFAKNEDNKDGSCKGTFIYMALEAYQTDVTLSSDIYSFGMFLLELIMDYDTFENYFDRSLAIHLQELKSGKWQAHIKETLSQLSAAGKCPSGFSSLILDCVQNDVKKRPTIANVISRLETVFKQLSIDLLQNQDKSKQKTSSLGLFKKDKMVKEIGPYLPEIPIIKLLK